MTIYCVFNEYGKSRYHLIFQQDNIGFKVQSLSEKSAKLHVRVVSSFWYAQYTP